MPAVRDKRAEELTALREENEKLRAEVARLEEVRAALQETLMKFQKNPELGRNA